MKKMLGEDRRSVLLQLLKSADAPITGTDLAKHANVSRQVVVNDMNLLKARNEPIISTSQGYIYIQEQKNRYERTIVCMHSGAQARQELYAIVDCGATVENVVIQHPVYGDLIASLVLSNRLEVDTFLKKLDDTNAGFLSDLTDGTHLHVISAPNEHALNQAVAQLDQLGILVKE